MPSSSDLILIGELAARSGVAPSALRFYESRGLLRSERSAGGHRLYRRNVTRRVAFIRIAQHVGLSLAEIGDALAILPPDRAPTKAEWGRLSRAWRSRIDERITVLAGLRDDLSSCIGCGCLSLRGCRLSNPGDVAGTRGTGPRYLLGDDPGEVAASADGRHSGRRTPSRNSASRNSASRNPSSGPGTGPGSQASG